MHNKPWMSLMIMGLLLDQASKWLATTYLHFGEVLNLFPGLNLYLTYNEGIAFSMMNQGGLWRHVLSGVTLIIIVGLLFWLYRLPARDKLSAISLNLIIGGAIGNLIDRFRLGHVVDFIDVYYQNWHWPTFNLADSWVCIGAAILIWGLFKQ